MRSKPIISFLVVLLTMTFFISCTMPSSGVSEPEEKDKIVVNLQLANGIKEKLISSEYGDLSIQDRNGFTYKTIAFCLFENTSTQVIIEKSNYDNNRISNAYIYVKLKLTGGAIASGSGTIDLTSTDTKTIDISITEK